ncbi:MAG: zinc ribbon domain-containing protein [Promethearchaeota archaeon]|nr:MAG: zinc ribbon domain-containing protein [Candidatus Lokiarchaeota archaeon]
MDDAEKQKLADKSLGEIIKDGFRLFIENYAKLILPLAFFHVLSVIIGVFALSDLAWQAAILRAKADSIISGYTGDPNQISQEEYDILTQSFLITILLNLIDYLIGAIFTVIAMCSVSSFIYKRYLGKPTEFKEEFKNAFNSKMIVVIVILGIGIPLGWTLFWIPGILIFVFFIFSIYTYNMEEVENPSKEARLISKGSFIKIIAVFLVTVIIIGAINFIYTLIMVSLWPVSSATLISWYNPSTRNYGMLILYELVYNVIQIMFAPLFICILTPLFASSKAQKDLGYPLKEKYASNQIRAKTSRQVEKNSAGRMFCPFCGHKILKPKKFCPSCGKSIEFK